MEKSSACEYPKNEPVSSEERNHPLFNEYRRYKSAMNAQLVYCVPFSVWLNWKND